MVPLPIVFKVQNDVEMYYRGTKQILTYDIVNYVTDKADILSNFGSSSHCVISVSCFLIV